MPEVERVADLPDEDERARSRAGAGSGQRRGPAAIRRTAAHVGASAHQPGKTLDAVGPKQASDEQREPGERGRRCAAAAAGRAAAQLRVGQQRAEGELPEAGGQEVERGRRRPVETVATFQANDAAASSASTAPVRRQDRRVAIRSSGKTR